MIVIGAGLAGLAAARKLMQNGQEVVVLESRERTGGRIWTSKHWPDIPLDLGASWIHGVKGNPLTDLADEIRADRLPTSYDRSVAYDSDGSILSGNLERQLHEIRKQVTRALEKAGDRDDDISIREATVPLIEESGNSAETERLLNFVLNAEIEQEYSGSVEQLSAHWWDHASEFDGGDVLFAKGFETLVDHLARDLQIETGVVVTGIRWDESPVRVTTTTSEFIADQVVVTVPLGVLKAGKIRFRPELPEAKLTAINMLGMGVLNKCYLRFDKPFWPDTIDWLEYVAARHGEWTEWVSFLRAAEKPILLGFNAADRGKEIESWSDREIVASAMQTLKTIFGAEIPEPIDFQITRWAKDPHAFGAYSFNALGSHPDMRDDLAAPLDDVVFFAGEATERDYFGTAHGAYLSGLRAAAELPDA